MPWVTKQPKRSVRRWLRDRRVRNSTAQPFGRRPGSGGCSDGDGGGRRLAGLAWLVVAGCRKSPRSSRPSSGSSAPVPVRSRSSGSTTPRGAPHHRPSGRGIRRSSWSSSPGLPGLARLRRRAGRLTRRVRAARRPLPRHRPESGGPLARGRPRLGELATAVPDPLRSRAAGRSSGRRRGHARGGGGPARRPGRLPRTHRRSIPPRRRQARPTRSIGPEGRLAAILADELPAVQDVAAHGTPLAPADSAALATASRSRSTSTSRRSSGTTVRAAIGPATSGRSPC